MKLWPCSLRNVEVGAVVELLRRLGAVGARPHAVVEVVPDVRAGQVDHLPVGVALAGDREVARVGRRDHERPGGGMRSGQGSWRAAGGSGRPRRRGGGGDRRRQHGGQRSDQPEAAAPKGLRDESHVRTSPPIRPGRGRPRCRTGCSLAPPGPGSAASRRRRWCRPRSTCRGRSPPAPRW